MGDSASIVIEEPPTIKRGIVGQTSSVVVDTIIIPPTMNRYTPNRASTIVDSSTIVKRCIIKRTA